MLLVKKFKNKKGGTHTALRLWRCTIYDNSFKIFLFVHCMPVFVSVHRYNRSVLVDQFGDMCYQYLFIGSHDFVIGLR